MAKFGGVKMRSWSTFHLQTVNLLFVQRRKWLENIADSREMTK